MLYPCDDEAAPNAAYLSQHTKAHMPAVPEDMKGFDPTELENDARLMRRFMGYLRPYRGRVAVVFLLMTIHLAAMLAAPVVLQRALDWFATLNAADQNACHALLNELGGPDLLDIGLERRLTRVGNCMALD